MTLVIADKLLLQTACKNKDGLDILVTEDRQKLVG